MKQSIPKQWYAKKPVVISLLILIFPLGLFLMWKFLNWRKRTKWIVTVIVALLLIVSLVGTYNSTPIINIANAENNKINTDDAEYSLKGDVSSLKDPSLTINNQDIELSDTGEYTYLVKLEEGDNQFSLVAKNENGVTEEIITIHRTTQAEFAVRAEAERTVAEKLMAEDAKIAQEKADADANAKVVADAKAQADTQSQQKVNTDIANVDAFYINNVYFKGDGRYEVVVYSSNKDTLQIYVNDENPIKAKVNKDGWATFKKVKLTGRSKLSFAKKTGWFKYYPVNYVKYITVDDEKVQLLDAEAAAVLNNAEAESKAQAEATEAARLQAETERIAQEEAKNIDTGELIALRDVAKNAILLVLKAPSTAKFADDGFWDDPLQGWSYGWATDYNEVYYLTSYVDSENSFGAMLRSQFQVGFRITDGNYNVVFVYFEGKVLLDNR